MDASDSTNHEIPDAVAIAQRPASDVQSHEDGVEDASLSTLEVNVHHMQMRAINLWAALLDEDDVPSIEVFPPTVDPTLNQCSILLDATRNREDPIVSHLGERLAQQCEIVTDISTLSQAPRHSLLSLLPHFLNSVYTSRRPNDFEATCTNRSGQRFRYYGMMLPFSSEGGEIDFVYCVISWSAEEFPVEETTVSEPLDELVLSEEYLIDEEGGTVEVGLPASELSVPDQEAGPQDGTIDGGRVDTPASTQFSTVSVETGTSAEAGSSLLSEGKGALADWLAEARRCALAARESEERSRNALYQAIGMAYDFSLVAVDSPNEFAQLISEAGLTVQERAPFTPLVKLVFGSAYEKSRLAEYAAAIAHAHRLGLEQGTLGKFLANAEGGLKGVVNAERQLKRMENGKPERSRDELRASLVKKLLEVKPRALSDLAAQGDEFTLVLAHRLPEGGVVMLGEVPRDIALLERAARKLMNAD